MYNHWELALTHLCQLDRVLYGGYSPYARLEDQLLTNLFAQPDLRLASAPYSWVPDLREYDRRGSWDWNPSSGVWPDKFRYFRREGRGWPDLAMTLEDPGVEPSVLSPAGYWWYFSSRPSVDAR